MEAIKQAVEANLGVAFVSNLALQKERQLGAPARAAHPGHSACAQPALRDRPCALLLAGGAGLHPRDVWADHRHHA